jgi:hypothetical protein
MVCNATLDLRSGWPGKRIARSVMIANRKGRTTIAERPFGLACLIWFHCIICCASLVYISYFKFPDYFTAATFHIFYDPTRFHLAAIIAALFSIVALLFVVARFTFGYFIGFYLYSMILTYLWLNCFSDLDYDHRLAGISAAVSAIAFLLPALLIFFPIRQTFILSARMLALLLRVIIILAVATIAIGAIYNFRIVGFEDIYTFREKLEFPTIISYLTGMLSGALLPFAFAVFAARKKYWMAGVVLVLLLLFYPVVLNKLVFFTPAWLVTFVLLSRFFGSRTTVLLSLLLPVLIGLLIGVPKTDAAFYLDAGQRYIYTVNFRILAIPAIAMDVYGDFFSTHELTYFCQISILKPFLSCPYHDQLSIVMERAYKLGNFNASLFATEGIASVGLLFAPAATFTCGLVIALGNGLSAGLPDRFVLVSGAVFPQILLNVPLSTALLTHGLAVLFLLWYITPRSIFENELQMHVPSGTRETEL